MSEYLITPKVGAEPIHAYPTTPNTYILQEKARTRSKASWRHFWWYVLYGEGVGGKMDRRVNHEREKT